MLQTLDIVIAFAVIMSVLSLLITIVVQMLSSALALRGKNLANGLALTFETIDPSLGKRAHQLADQILRDPIFSDSVWTTKLRAAGKGSVLVGLEAKVDEAFVAWAKVKALPATDPGLIEARKSLDEAWKTLDSPEVQPKRDGPWNFWNVRAMTLASAVRPGEIYRLLHQWARLSPKEAKEQGLPVILIRSAEQLLQALDAKDNPQEESVDKLKALNEVAGHFDPAVRTAVVTALQSLENTVERATTQAYDRFQRWFGTAQDRAEQWFRLHTRGITVAASIAIAFGLQLDTLEIFSELRARPEVVTALVKQATAVAERGDATLTPANVPLVHAYRAWLRVHPLYPLDPLPKLAANEQPAAVEEWVGALRKVLERSPPPMRAAESSPVIAFEAECRRRSLEEDGVEKAYAEWLRLYPHFAVEEPEKYAKAAARAAAIAQRIQQVHDQALGSEKKATAARNQWLNEFRALAESGSAYFEAQRENAAALNRVLSDAGFNLVPSKLFGRWPNEAWVWTHLLGLALTAGLLTLGAPFWFNLLKNLSGLRPALANLIERRPQSAPALPSEPTAPAGGRN